MHQNSRGQDKHKKAFLSVTSHLSVGKTCLAEVRLQEKGSQIKMVQARNMHAVKQTGETRNRSRYT